MNYLVIGSGIFGSTFAYEAAKRGNRVKVIEKRNHIGGNIYTKKIAGIDVHMYGAHIFHTQMKKIWDYINRFATFNNFVNSPVANYHGHLYNLPFNMNTFHQLWGISTPKEAQTKINSQRLKLNRQPKNLEEQALFLGGPDIYNTLIKGYTEKQWGRSAKDLPAFIIRRLPFRFTYNNNYFNDPYQGIPIDGYTQIIQKMLKSPLIHIELNTDFFDHKSEYLNGNYDKIVYTGPIDQFFNYKLGALAYRSLKFKTEVKNVSNYQGNAVMNYTSAKIPYTRVIEHKWFEHGRGNRNQTVITHEYPQEWNRYREPYYPVNDQKSRILYSKYVELARQQYKNVIFGGRLGQYRYYNMDQAIMAALELVNQICNN